MEIYYVSMKNGLANRGQCSSQQTCLMTCNGSVDTSGYDSGIIYHHACDVTMFATLFMMKELI